MPNIPRFDEKIKQIIKYFEYDMYLVHPDPKINCTCLDMSTHQGDPNCMNCLGTGKKIFISKIRAARQPYTLVDTRFANMNGSDGSVYYTRDIYPLHKNDILITGTYADVVQYVLKYQSDHYAPVYYAAYTAPKGAYKETFLNHFRELVGDDA